MAFARNRNWDRKSAAVRAEMEAAAEAPKAKAAAQTKPAISPERLAQIRADAKSGTNWAKKEAAEGNSPSGPYGATCVCGAGQRTLDAATALQGLYGRPTGSCARHPGGTVHTPPEGLWEAMRKEGKA